VGGAVSILISKDTWWKEEQGASCIEKNQDKMRIILGKGKLISDRRGGQGGRDWGITRSNGEKASALPLVRRSSMTELQPHRQKNKLGIDFGGGPSQGRIQIPLQLGKKKINSKKRKPYLRKSAYRKTRRVPSGFGNEPDYGG